MISNSPYIFDIARSSTVDGEGIRSIVFTQGCPLRCSWCHNPESWDYVAPKKLPPNWTHADYYEPSKLVNLLMRDYPYYKVSNGGVTFSGGEPLSHCEYIGDIAKRLHDKGVSTIIETSGYFDYSSFEKFLLPYTKALLYDIKIFDEQKHIQYTGKSNALILKNLKQLVLAGVNIIPRTPLIPNITDTKENLENITNLLRLLKLEKKHILLPYNIHTKIKAKVQGKSICSSKS